MKSTSILLFAAECALGALAGLLWSNAAIRALLKSAFERKTILPRSPHTISTVEVIFTFSLVLLKYVVFTVGKPFGFKTLVEDSTGHFNLPPVEIESPLIVKARDVVKYNRVISTKAVTEDAKQKEDANTNPIFLVPALTTPLLIVILTKMANPVLPLGAVNVRNRFEFVDVQTCRSVLKVQKAGMELRAKASMGGSNLKGRRVKRGMEFDVVIEVTASKRVICRQIITVLALLGAKPKTLVDQASKATEDVREYSDGQDSFTVSFNAPRDWAGVCKDYNPIHISTLAAKLFGFPGKIAHGNLVAAMALEATDHGKEGHGSIRNLWSSPKKACWLSVSYKRPMVVPITLQLRELKKGGSFDVTSTRKDEEKTHVQIDSGYL